MSYHFAVTFLALVQPLFEAPTILTLQPLMTSVVVILRPPMCVVIDACGLIDPGLMSATEIKRAQVSKLLVRLEVGNPAPEPASSPLLNGTWELGHLVPGQGCTGVALQPGGTHGVT